MTFSLQVVIITKEANKKSGTSRRWNGLISGPRRLA